MRTLPIICLLLINLSAYQAFSQSNSREGFIIRLTHDTIHGTIEYPGGSEIYRSCIFNDGKTTINYMPAELAGYGLKDYKFFSSQILTGYFVEVLVSGKLSLYKYERHYYIQKEGERLLLLEHKKPKGHIDGKFYSKEDHTWKNLLTAMSSDCPQIIERLRTAWFNEKNITDFILRYYQCTGNEYIEYKANIPWTKLGVEINTGLSYFKISNIKGKVPNLKNTISSLSPVAGLTLLTTFPRTEERFSIQLDVLYRKRDYTSSSMLIQDEQTVYNDLRYQLNSLTVPLSVRYTASNLKLPLYFYVGINYTFFIQSEYLIRAEIVKNNVVRTYQNKDNLNNKIMPGFHCGLGTPISYKGINGSIGTNLMSVYHYRSNFKSASIYLNLSVL